MPTGQLEADHGEVRIESAAPLGGYRGGESAGGVELRRGVFQDAVQDAVDRDRPSNAGVIKPGVRRAHLKESVERLTPACHRERQVVVQEQATRL